MWGTCLLVVVCAVGGATSAAADEAAPETDDTAIASPTVDEALAARRAQSQQLFAEGRAAFEQRHFAEALRVFQHAYDLLPLPALLYNIARCHDELQNLGSALEAYQRFGAIAEPVGAQEARQRILDVERRIASARTPAPLAPTVSGQVASVVASRAPVRRSRRALWIGLGAGGGALLMLAVGLGVGLRARAPQPSFAPVDLR